MRPFEPSDAPAAHQVYSDEHAMRWVGTGPVVRFEQTEAMLAGYIAHQRRYGFSFWAVVERNSGHLIGDAGLYTRLAQIELGYTLGHEHWGKGYGTEAAAACVRVAFERLELSQLEALVRPENIASAALVRKLGFEDCGREFVHQSPHILFRLLRDSSTPNAATSNGGPR